MANWRRLAAGIERQERSRGTARDRAAEASRFDWYAEGCPCGLAPGACREHPRARPSQRPPAGDWRTWLVLAGRGFGKTRCAAEWIRHRVEIGAAPSDRPGGRHGGRRAGRDGRGPQRPAGGLPARFPAAVRAVEAAADLAQRCGGDDLLGRRAGPAPRAAIGLRLARRAGGVPLPGGRGQPALRPPPGR